MIVLSEAEVRELLDLDELVDALAAAHRDLSAGEASMPPRIAALVQEQAFDDLDAPVGRVTGADLPMPYSKPLEQIAFPHEPQVIEAVLATFGDV